jgi:hypothetical protein
VIEVVKALAAARGSLVYPDINSVYGDGKMCMLFEGGDS